MRGLVTVPPERVSVIAKPVLSSAVSIWSTVAVAQAERRAAKVPATWGVAIEVPARHA